MHVEARARAPDYTGRMSLEMKAACDRCGAAVTGMDRACICSDECTFCAACAGQLAYRCRNCGGELVWRPRLPNAP
jgi:hypothetical protein